MSPAEDERDQDPVASGRARSALLLVAVVGAWNLYEAVVAPNSHAAIPPTLFVVGAIALGIAVAGPRWARVAAFFVGAVLCLVALASTA